MSPNVSSYNSKPLSFSLSLATSISLPNSTLASAQSSNVATLYSTELNAYTPKHKIAHTGKYVMIMPVVEDENGEMRWRVDVLLSEVFQREINKTNIERKSW
jgi:hypothetical protein